MSLTTFEQSILDSITVGSENDPLRPEFPPLSPKFPATPTTRIRIDGFPNVFLKDESKNPTGTHKDRMAWEIVVTYRDFLLAKQNGQTSEALIPMSIISSGSAAVAIQTLFRYYKLPNLRVLLDAEIDTGIYDSLIRLGCEIYLTDLSKKALNSRDILALTHNSGGIDITSSEALNPTTRFYDWLSYEIISTSPHYCFVPFGTGNLFENIMNINRREVTTDDHDPRFSGVVEVLRNCHFIGATTNNPKSLATKLYSPHLPFVHFDDQWLRLYIQAGYCGGWSSVELVREEYLQQAATIADQNGISFEISGLAGLAMFLQMKDTINPENTILVVNTGKTKY
jgi:hypothetical protein